MSIKNRKPQRAWSKPTLAVLNMLGSQKFSNFYAKEMDDYISGGEDAPSGDDVCSTIASMIGEKEAAKLKTMREDQERMLTLAGIITEGAGGKKAGAVNMVCGELSAALKRLGLTVGHADVQKAIRASVSDAYEAGYDDGDKDASR